ncbi:hypothetical protein AB0M95_15555 [Sphaerisporangium sp. NPDC051017]|uniref:hypothetical protein n=1 Tax=Sphaerisporangium sp. NPDC051017 TaxID=3154636 RepID=UPI00341C6636
MTTPSAAGPERLGPALIDVLTLLPEGQARPVRAKLRELYDVLHSGVRTAIEAEPAAVAVAGREAFGGTEAAGVPDGWKGEYLVVRAAREALESVLYAARSATATGTASTTAAPALTGNVTLAGNAGNAADASKASKAGGVGDDGDDADGDAGSGDAGNRAGARPLPGDGPSHDDEPAPTAPPSREDVVAGALRELCRELAEATQTKDYARAYKLTDLTGPHEEWSAGVRRRISLLFLRLAPQEEEEWRRRAAELVSEALDGHAEDADDLEVARLLEAGAGPSPVVDPEFVTTLLGEDRARGERWRPLAELAAAVAWLAEHDPATWVGLAGVVPGKDLRPAAREVTSYRSAIASRFAGLLDKSLDDTKRFVRLAETDEAIRGLVPIPLPRQGSWWDRQVELLRKIIDEHPGGRGATMITPGSVLYKDVRQSMSDDCIQLRQREFLELVRGEPGSIVWTLRLGYGDKRARVVYIPSS